MLNCHIRIIDFIIAMKGEIRMNDLKTKFETVMKDYDAAYKAHRKSSIFKSRIDNTITKDIPTLLGKYPALSGFVVDGSVGHGNPAKAPFVFMGNPKVTTTPKSGVYLVYIINKDEPSLYLALLQGSNTVTKGSSKSKKSALSQNAIKIRGKLGLPDPGPMSCGSPDYDAGCIYWKKYAVSSLPIDDSELYKDLDVFIGYYSNYCNTILGLPETNQTSDYRNLIIYGIPGCGKSYRLKTEYLTKGFSRDNVVRTTFHPEYTNTDFVGQVRPVKNGKDLDYEVIPGPFTRALFLALQSPEKKVALVIEEINRGNAAAIFGDLFQLLDRDLSGKSEYEIVNETISNYLNEKGIEIEKNEIRIPSNLYLYATMNTSDQNVFKLDTAFKRRWEFERLTNKDTEGDIKDFTVFTINGTDVKWKEFIKEVNAVISSDDDISGDRQIGNFFYEGSDGDLKRFANKVLEYLYNDVFKYGGREKIFDCSKYKSFDAIYDAFINGENVFAKKLANELLEDYMPATQGAGGAANSPVDDTAVLTETLNEASKE